LPVSEVPFGFPVVLDLTGRACLVVGGGRVAARKVAALLAAGAAVTVVAPEVEPDLAALAGTVAVERRPYRTGEAAGYRLVITATGDAAVDAAVTADAEAAGVWANAADDPAHCSFILPAVHRDGPVTLAVSTGGASPALATYLRDRYAADGPAGLAALAGLLAEARRRVQAEGRPTGAVDWRALLDGPLPGLVAAGDHDAARRLVDAAIRDPSA
jgi:siroheme synthase-like protein